MDHFALPSDGLNKAAENKTLHRNFMGYTTNSTELMIGLGMSAISDSWGGFAQNVKSVKEYQNLIESRQIPVFRGHILTEEDKIIRQHILHLMCRSETNWKHPNSSFESLPEVIIKLDEMVLDGIINQSNSSIKIPELNRVFLRNICMAFDLRLHRLNEEKQMFSMTI